MHGFLPLIAGGLVMIALGAVQLLTPLDVLWKRQERDLLARGLSPQRSGAWERNARRGGGVMIGIGVVLLILVVCVQSSIPPPMSGVSIDGHELTKQEWDDCHHDAPTCLSAYMNRQPR